MHNSNKCHSTLSNKAKFIFNIKKYSHPFITLHSKGQRTFIYSYKVILKRAVRFTVYVKHN